MNNNQALGLTVLGLGAIALIASQNSNAAPYYGQSYNGYYSSYGSPGGYGITVSQDQPGYWNTNYQPFIKPGY